MQHIGTIQSIQVGTPVKRALPETVEAKQSTWKTSFFRAPSPEPRWLYTTHLDGNEQADKKNHGRPSQAVLLYAASHYPLWQEELALPEIGPGGFGENLTIEGLSETNACIGDIYGIGEAQIQVTGPRYPCTKIQRRWGRPGLTDLVAENGRTGWYCRVLHEGLLEPGQKVELVKRSYPRWTVALTNDFAHLRNGDVETARELATCPLLDKFWGELVVQQARKRAKKIQTV